MQPPTTEGRPAPEDPSRPVRSGLFGLTVGRPIAMGVLFVTLVLLGVIAYSRIPLQFLPGGIEGSRFTINVPNAGASAQENVDKVARVLEEQFRTIQGIEQVRSYSYPDRVRMRVNFSGDADAKLSKAELRDRIERARAELPDTVERIWIWASDDGDMPIMFFAIQAKERSDDVTVLIDKEVQKRLEAVDGVSRVSIWGLLDESIRIFLDEEKVAAAKIDLGQVIQRLATDNFAQPLGEVRDGDTEYILRSDMRFQDLDEIRDYPVRDDGLRLGDLGTVERVNSVRDRITRIDGDFAYYGMVQKEGSANVVEVGTALAEVLEGLEDDPRLEGRLSASIFFNQADFIESSLERLESTAIQGGGLAVLVLFLFLRRARMTLCVALCIPVSALLALAYESFSGGSFNVLTMTGLTLGIGMLVDNAVVVIESIARQRGLGRAPGDAAVLGARDVGLAVALATMTSVVVFLPLIFMGEQRMSVFLQAMGVPLCASLLFSLFVALVFIPTAAARVIGDRPAWARRAGARLAVLGTAPTRALAWVIGGVRFLFFQGLRAAHVAERLVLGALAWPTRIAAATAVGYLGYTAWSRAAGHGALAGQLEALGVPSGTVGALESTAGTSVKLAAGLVVAILVAVPLWRREGRLAPRRPARFVPAGDSIVGWAQASNRALLGWTLQHRVLATALSVVAFMSISIPAKNTSMTAFGEDEDTSELELDVDLEDNFTLRQASEEMERYERWVRQFEAEFRFEHVVSRFDADGGEIELRWPTRIDPDRIETYRQRLRDEVPRYPGHRVRFRGDEEISDSSKQFAFFEIRGPSPDTLDELSERAVALLEGVPGLTDVATSTEEAPDQLLLELDGDMAFAYGLNSQGALRSVGWALRGSQLARFQDQDREVPMFIEYDDTAYAGLDTLNDLSVWGENGAVPLSTFSNIRFQPAPTRIVRRNGQTSTTITARLEDPTAQAKLIEAGYDALAGLDLPRGYTLGRDDSAAVRGAEEMAGLQNAALLSVVLVFLLMGILFESLLLPFSVLTTIPFAILGAFWTLFITGTPMDSIGWIGIIILVGVVVNNGIVLIDKIHRLRVEEGLPRHQAVLDGAAARVRPILMTALTTVVGLLPMAMGDAPAQGIDYRALSTCVAGGLAICTFFTLWVVPLAYTLIDDLSRNLGWVTRRAFAGAPAPARRAAGPTGGAAAPAARADAP